MWSVCFEKKYHTPYIVTRSFQGTWTTPASNTQNSGHRIPPKFIDLMKNTLAMSLTYNRVKTTTKLPVNNKQLKMARRICISRKQSKKRIQNTIWSGIRIKLLTDDCVFSNQELSTINRDLTRFAKEKEMASNNPFDTKDRKGLIRVENKRRDTIRWQESLLPKGDTTTVELERRVTESRYTKLIWEDVSQNVFKEFSEERRWFPDEEINRLVMIWKLNCLSTFKSLSCRGQGKR